MGSEIINEKKEQPERECAVCADEAGAAPLVALVEQVQRNGTTVNEYGVELGSFRFDAAFETAVRSIEARRIDVRPLLTGVLPMSEAKAAFDMAGDRTRSIKVHIGF